MPERFSRISSAEKNRKQRKATWIRAKNLMRKYPDCAYNGDFYCDHVYEPHHPWVWIDFRFFHTKLKRYFAVAMVTTEYHAWNQAEDKAYSMIEFPECNLMYDRTDAEYGKLYRLEHSEEMNEALNKKDILLEKLLAEEYKIMPKINVRRRYGSVIIGVDAIVNTPYIDEHYIRDFIKFFRTLGEPMEPGIVWTGEEVAVVPARLKERYKDA